MPRRNRNKITRIPFLSNDLHARQRLTVDKVPVYVGDILIRSDPSSIQPSRRNWIYRADYYESRSAPYGLTRLVDGKETGDLGEWACWITKECTHYNEES